LSIGLLLCSLYIIFQDYYECDRLIGYGSLTHTQTLSFVSIDRYKFLTEIFIIDHISSKLSIINIIPVVLKKNGK